MLNDANHYNRTILHMMMYYPNIFPSEFHCQNHLFLTIGNGYQWNEKGQLQSIGETERNIQRTKESVLGNMSPEDIAYFEDGKRVCFYPCGTVFKPFDEWSKFSPLSEVLSGQVEPAPDWKEAIIRFCGDILIYDLSRYRQIVMGYYLSFDWSMEIINRRASTDIKSFNPMKIKANELYENLTGEKWNRQWTPEFREAQKALATQILKEISEEKE